MKKWISLFCISTLLMTLFPGSSFAASITVGENQSKTVYIQPDQSISQSTSYNLMEGSTLILEGLGSAMGVVKMPLQISHNNVTVILDNINWDIGETSLGKTGIPITVDENVTGTKIIVKSDSNVSGINGYFGENQICSSGMALSIKGEANVLVQKDASLTIKGGFVNYGAGNNVYTYYGSNGIYIGQTGSLTFSGEGNISVKGGKGPNGYNPPYSTTDGVTNAGGKGATGGYGIYNLGEFSISMTAPDSNSGTVEIRGGDGSTGGRGETAVICSHSRSSYGSCINVVETKGGTGGTGGTPGIGIYSLDTASVTVNSGLVFVKTGERGAGGSGGYANPTSPLTFNGREICDGNHSFPGDPGITGSDTKPGISGGTLNLLGGSFISCSGCFDEGEEDSNGNTKGIKVNKLNYEGGTLLSTNKCFEGMGQTIEGTILDEDMNSLKFIHFVLEDPDMDYSIKSIEVLNGDDQKIYEPAVSSTYYLKDYPGINFMIPESLLDSENTIQIIFSDDEENDYLFRIHLNDTNIIAKTEDLIGEEPYFPGYPVTSVTYTGKGEEAYTLTVPSLLEAGGEPLEVCLAGTWSSTRRIRVFVEDFLLLYSTVNPEEYVTSQVHFDEMNIQGNDRKSKQYIQKISVDPPEEVLFGNWTGTLVFTIEAGQYE